MNHQKFKIFVESLRDQSNDETINTVLEGYELILQEGLFDFMGGTDKAIKQIANDPSKYNELPEKLKLNKDISEKFAYSAISKLNGIFSGNFDFYDPESTNKHKFDAIPNWIKSDEGYDNIMNQLGDLSNGFRYIYSASKKGNLQPNSKIDGMSKEFHKNLNTIGKMKNFIDSESSNRRNVINYGGKPSYASIEAKRKRVPEQARNASQLRQQEIEWRENNI